MEGKLKDIEKKLAREKKARKLLEEEIELKSRNVYLAYQYNKQVLDSLGIGIVITNSEGKVKEMNKKAQSQFPEVNTNEPRTFWEILNIDEEIIKKFLNSSEREMARDFEYSLDNNAFSVHLTKNEIKKVELIFTTKDVTSKKKQESKIKELQDKIIKSSYRDGVAENATSVLHNIGNVLTTIINSATKSSAMDQFVISNNILVKFSSLLNSFKTKEEVIEFINEDERGKRFIPLLVEITKNLEEVEESLKDYVQLVDDKCFHIAEIISSQQKLANFKEKHIEKINLHEMVSDCHTMHQDRLEKRSIVIKMDIDPNVNIHIEKIGFAQVISNLILNAIESIDDKFKKDPYYRDKEIVISTKDNDEYFILSFKDNGMGADLETLKKLFSFGFSTKKRGSGFGLHNCSNFMIASNGKIEMTSAGFNLGATILLYCPKEKGRVKTE
jgi:signal transduction histidine kinase